MPFVPMSPIAADSLPEGTDWGYQLKWDGYRLIVSIEDGEAKLFSKKMLPQNGKYPEIARACSNLKGTLVLDGEAVVLDPDTGRPSFQLLQQRNKPGASASTRQLHVQYIVFDVLRIGDEDLRGLPFAERDRRLRELAANWEAPLHTTDLFANGPLLWEWVVRNGWEGVVCKKLSSRYREGKEHRDWLKCKRKPEYDVEIVGVLWKEGRVSSMVMGENGAYFGRVSSGLNGALKEKLRVLGNPDRSLCPFADYPEALKGFEVRWLQEPIGARVTGSERTEDGVLRHPKLLMLDL
ncbi:DNA ligase [Cohnella pontilimi]|uniref:DNA ligase n=1 Tax=Cohnella pontilimi TaxID=2564100 RepID=A0A4U0FHP7_9BACL|nr:DNA ligase [Cohnella pontilimi]